MVATGEAWRTRLDVQTQFREWESWYAHLNEQLTKVPGQRLYEICRNPPEAQSKPAASAPAVDVAGRWDVEVQYEVGSAQHKLFLTSKGNQIGGSHVGWAFEGDLNGKIDGDVVEIRSVLPAGGQHLSYNLRGKVSGDAMSGDVDLGEYGRARWKARRHSAGALA